MGTDLAGAATVVEDGDHGGAAGEVVERGGTSLGRAEERGYHGSGGAGLHDLDDARNGAPSVDSYHALAIVYNP
jgi:hypothetical protein